MNGAIRVLSLSECLQQIEALLLSGVALIIACWAVRSLGMRLYVCFALIVKLGQEISLVLAGKRFVIALDQFVDFIRLKTGIVWFFHIFSRLDFVEMIGNHFAAMFDPVTNGAGWFV